MSSDAPKVVQIRSPHDRYQWSLAKLQLCFRIAGQDIFSKDFHRTVWFYVLAGAWVMAIVFNILTAVDFDNCIIVTRYLCTLLIGGSLEVGFLLPVKLLFKNLFFCYHSYCSVVSHRSFSNSFGSPN